MAEKHQANHLKKILGVAFGIAVVVGGTIGVGILRTPAIIASELPNAALILGCWIAIGLYIILSASSYAELTTMIPRAGGSYNYIKLAFGRYSGFITGWFDFIANAVAPAYYCIVLSEYSALLFPGLRDYQILSAIFFLTVFMLINLPGVRSGSATQKITSAAKIILFLILIAGCFLAQPVQHIGELNTMIIEGGMVLAVFKSLQLIIGSYNGWASVSFFAEEDENPGRNIPKSYLIGSLTVMLLYVLINAAILYVLPVDVIAVSPLAASEAAAVAFGNWSTNMIIAIAIFSLFSILNAYMMIPPRILFGLSRDGFFLKQGTKINKGGTPYVSLFFCYFLALVLIFFSSFQQLFSLGAFLLTIVTGFAFLSLIRLRIRRPELNRPYKAWGYPFSTYFTLLITVILCVGFAASDRLSLMIIVGLLLVSYPCYRLFVQGKQE